MVSADHVLQLSCVSLSMLPFAVFPQNFYLLCVVALARLSTEELCENTNDERSVAGQRYLWNIFFLN